VARIFEISLLGAENAAGREIPKRLQG